MKRSRDGEDDDQQSCTAVLRGACDCQSCLKLIIRNSNKLLQHGWHVNFCDNGPGGYGFDVNSSSEMLRKLISGYIEIEDSIVIDAMSDEETEKMCRIVPSAWTGYNDNDELVKAWRPFFHLLEQKNEK